MIEAAGGGLATIVRPLDRIRGALLRAIGRSGRMFLARRSARVVAIAALGLVSTFLLAFLAPLWAFALGPIVLGVPHLLADVRYLVVQRGLHRRSALACSVGIPIVLGTIEGSPVLGLSAGFGAIVFAHASRSRAKVGRVLLLAGWVAVIAIVARHRATASLVLLHGHNVLAVVVFLLAFARSRLVGVIVALGFTGAALAVIGGVCDPWLFHATTGPRTGLDFGGMLDAIAPIPDPILATRLAILFVFAQGFHYLVWLRIVPEEARERPGLRSFASSLRALQRDMGKPALALFALFAVVIAARATFSLEAARLLYLRAAGFHGYLEVALALLFAIEGRSRS